jgi:hypothetical protein
LQFFQGRQSAAVFSSTSKQGIVGNFLLCPLLTLARPAAPAAASTHISLSIPAHLIRLALSEIRIGDPEWKILAIAG